MNLTGGIVLFAVIWFMTFLVSLQIGARSQADSGEIVPGTPAGAPASLNLRRKLIVTTIITIILWTIIAAIILSGAIGLRDIDWFNRLGTETSVR
ncbi:putative secreted protein [Albidovulum inexpectatum]|uniref:Putative secreted protein n=1 Tax=Albidovulum inexpectatum TaxID=196587 RepID=A0A2S5JEB6_9RHOB|nr:DUF1467 family protein [Albidovulum inexpectatum]PPB79866.1 putative secreted protein [Albidovulum inexpectatum]